MHILTLSWTVYSAFGVGDRHICGINADGDIECEGDNSSDQLEDIPNQEMGNRFVDISVGQYHQCVIQEQGNVTCFGDPDRTVGAPSTSTPFKRVSAGYNHTCLIGESPSTGVLLFNPRHCSRIPIFQDANDNVQCFGDDSTNVISNRPSPGSPFHLELASGNGFSCAIRDDKSIGCWGDPKVPNPGGTGPFRKLCAGEEHAW